MAFDAMVAERWAKKCFGNDEDKITLSIALAWHAWLTAKNQDYPPSVWAVAGVRAVRAGRDLPGLQSKFRDVWTRLTKWSGAGMDEARDRRPGPDRIVEQREMLSYLLGRIHEQKRLVVLALMDGERTKDVARMFRLTEGRISQIRREVMEDLDTMS